MVRYGAICNTRGVKINIMKVLLFGTGEYYNRYKIWFKNEEIIALVDNSIEKQGKHLDGKNVISPVQIVNYEYDAVFVMSFYIKDIKKQLLSLGVKEDKIYHFYDIPDLIAYQNIKEDIKIYRSSFFDESKKDVLVLNQDLTLGGPALALFQAAKILKKHGRKVTYASQIDGPLKHLIEKEEIEVIVDQNLLVETMNECGWISGYSQIICNTINFHIFLSKRDTSIPMIWWLHDALFFYDGVYKKAINEISRENLKIWAVGPVSEKAIKTFRPDFLVEDLLYGVVDSCGVRTLEEDRKTINFITIGYIEERKGQDVLLKAIKMLPEAMLQKTHFCFVGRNTSLLAKRIMDEAQNIKEIEFMGLVDRAKINELLKESDVLICPSREDPMPTVCAEAMMHSVPCIISDAAGTTKYISDMQNGMIFRNEDENNLLEKIEWAIDNKSMIRNMGVEARTLFENIFSMDVFEKKLVELLM